jgi:hypothetical protein
MSVATGQPTLRAVSERWRERREWLPQSGENRRKAKIESVQQPVQPKNSLFKNPLFLSVKAKKSSEH